MTFLTGLILIPSVVVGVTAVGALITNVYKSFRNFNNGNNKSLSFGETTTIDWKTLKDIYRVKPNRWRYESVIRPNCCYQMSEDKVLLYDAGENWDDRLKIVRVQLSFIDWVKFNWHKRKPRQTKGIELILDTAQDDIFELKSLARKEIDQANEQMQEIQKKISEGVTLQI